ncbi:ATP-binding protein [Gramella jeungdoensis]|uniref:ATP-binding protein n=1 Tax=Gramella jeungdoensis TaxID=708091 RepID=A0ABT0Z1X6_9FLAO|nr:AAA family ATPase [Gramella jeungdoensis]MCM8569544.1 ATP-binding protein [Gramella jeungdoensis]
MKLRQSKRSRAKIKMALQGPSGSGKTYSALLLAHGLIGGDFSKVAVIDTENNSSDLYAHLGNYKVLSLQPPFSPERYRKAIGICESEGMEVIIIDSITHCWEFLLEYHSSLPGNSFANWNKVTPRQKEFTNAILQSSCHIISTIRTKQDYVLNQRDGKYVPEKVGLKAIQRDGMDYEFTLVFDINIKHQVIASKDRTGLFIDKPEFKINSSIGRQIKRWCENSLTLSELKSKVESCSTIEQLTSLFRENQDLSKQCQQDFIDQKKLLEQLTNQKHTQNGTTNN